MSTVNIGQTELPNTVPIDKRFLQHTVYRGDIFILREAISGGYFNGKDATRLARHLLQVEALGLLNRRIIPVCALPDQIPDRYVAMGYVPPRLVYCLDTKVAYHVYGDESFYEKYPDVLLGGESVEAIVVYEQWLSISNYLAQESMYILQFGDGFASSLIDKLSVSR